MVTGFPFHPACLPAGGTPNVAIEKNKLDTVEQNQQKASRHRHSCEKTDQEEDHDKGKSNNE